MIADTQYIAEADEFLDHFKTPGGDFDEYQHDAVSYTSLTDLRDSMPDTGHAPDKFIRGLSVCWGLTDDNEIILYYVPVYGDLKSETADDVTFDLSEKSGDLIAIIDGGNNRVYINDNGTLDSIMGDATKEDAAKGHVTNYRNNIRIVRRDGSTGSYDKNNDTKSAYIPFQEIDALEDTYGSGTIYFTSTSIVDSGDYRHSLVLSHVDPIGNPPAGELAANHMNLCPPKCKEVIYPLQ